MNILRMMLLSLSVGAALTTQSCTTDNANKDAYGVKAAIAKFHDQFNKNAYAEIYSESETRFKQGCPEADFVELLTKVHQISGDYTGGTQSEFLEETDSNGHFVTSTQKSTFKTRPIVEIFKYTISDDGKPLLYNWKTGG